ncbi:hypothetical protein [Nonomuraea sp. NPDC049158]|uniref:hypothetical protein n=1 Tax=Nonomuraea sp. NPDC049158 TaxID=3155649 RepID=UPI0033C79474
MALVFSEQVAVSRGNPLALGETAGKDDGLEPVPSHGRSVGAAPDGGDVSRESGRLGFGHRRPQQQERLAPKSMSVSMERRSSWVAVVAPSTVS